MLTTDPILQAFLAELVEDAKRIGHGKLYAVFDVRDGVLQSYEPELYARRVTRDGLRRRIETLRKEVL